MPSSNSSGRLATLARTAVGDGRNFTASPVLVGDNLFATNESGRTFIVKADPTGVEVLAEIQLNGEDLASPAICGSSNYMRVAINAGKAAGDGVLFGD